MQGYLSLVLHAHLPFVRHPEHDEFLEEDWLYEAITETYLPLLQVFDKLVNDRVPFRVTLSITPTLASMLRDELLMERYVRRLDKLIELAKKEVHRTAKDASFHPLACFYRDRFSSARAAFHETYRRDLVGAFRKLQDAGALEIITSGATHGFLPLMQGFPEAVRAQLAVAAAHYRDAFARDAPGIWLPECGYYPGLERYLAAQGIRYFFLDGHGVLDATPRPRFGVYAPIYTATGTAAFGRDAESSQQVWSAQHGYPGDFGYREFYRDIGYDLDLEYVRPYVQPSGARKNTGIKYYRITGKMPDKEPYDRPQALERAAAHAGDFLSKRKKQIQHLAWTMGRPPIVVAPYDAELFGHWWFEGPEFLDLFIRKSAKDQQTYQLATPSDFLRDNPDNQLAAPPMCSWGAGGYSDVWLNGSNEWIYRHLHKATERMIALARNYPKAASIRRRALNQAARELLLAQSSDWAFILKTGTMVEYAVKRTKEHLLRFNRLHEQIRSDAVDESWLAYVEMRDNLFPTIDYRIYRPGLEASLPERRAPRQAPEPLPR